MTKKGGEKSKFEMLQLVLGKRLPARDDAVKDDTDNNGIDYFVCGYYDTLKLKVCDGWHDLRPGCSKEDNKYIKNDYSIRLLRIKNDDTRFSIDKIRDYPIFACCLIHLKGECLSGVKKEFFYSKVNLLSEKLPINGGVIECFVDLGFSDMAVLMFTNSIDQIKETVKKIRSNTVDGIDVSAAYTLIGYNADRIEKCEGTISVELDIAVKESCSLENQEQVIKGLFDDLQCDYNLNYNLMLGSYDWKCRIEEIDLKRFLTFHKSCFDPTETDRGKLRLLETHFLLGIIANNASMKADYSDDGLISIDNDVYKAYCCFKTMYLHMQKMHNSHNRASRAVYEVLTLYYKVAASSHSEDVKKIVGRFIVSYLHTVTALMMHMENINDVDGDLKDDGTLKKNIGATKDGDPRTIKINGNKNYRYCNYVNEIEDSIGKFRDAVEPLLFDIWRADSAYFEGQSTEHPSIGSAIKLLFAYNRTLEQLDSTYLKWEKEHPSIPDDTDFTYLVTSGGRDVTVNTDLFDGNSDILLKYRISENGDIMRGSDGDKISRPVIVIMPEASLYDIKGSLLRMLHEFFHKRGDRCRNERAKFYFESLCFISAENLKHAVAEKLVKEKAKNIFTNRYYRDPTFRKKQENLIEENHKNGDFRSDFAILFEMWIEDLHKKEYEKDLCEIGDFYDKIKVECGPYFVALSGDVCKKLQTIDDEEFLEAICWSQKIDKQDDIDWTSNKIFDSIINVFYNGAKHSVTCEQVGKCIQKCFIDIRSKLEELGYKLNIDSKTKVIDCSFLKAPLDAFCYGKQNCSKLWLDYISRLKGENRTLNCIVFTDIDNWYKNFQNVEFLFKSLFIESYADGMAFAVMANDGHFSGVEGFVDYLLTSLFELRDYKYLFNMHANGCNIDGEVPEVEFNGLYLQMIIAEKLLWGSCTVDDVEANKNLIVDKIKDYYNNTLYRNSDKNTVKQYTAEQYAKALYGILLRVIECGKQESDGKYLYNVCEYLNTCKTKNESLFTSLYEVVKDISNEDSYFNFVIEKWLNIYN